MGASADRFRPRRILGVYADGDTVIAHFHGSATTDSGRRYENNYVWILRLRDVKAIRATALFDSLAFDERWRQEPAAPQ